MFAYAIGIPTREVGGCDDGDDASDDDDIVLEAGDASDDHASLRHCKPADQASGDASEDGGRQRPRKSKNQARGPVQRTIFV